MLRWMPTSRQQRIPRPAIILAARCPALHEAAGPRAETGLLAFVALGGANKGPWGDLGWPKAPRGPQERTGVDHGRSRQTRGQCAPHHSKAQKAGATTLRQIAEALNARGVATARGGRWHAKSVSNILERA